MTGKIIALLIFVCITAIRGELILDSLVSFIAYILLSVINLDLWSFWNPRLIEYWIAGVVWIVTGAALVMSLTSVPSVFARAGRSIFGRAGTAALAIVIIAMYVSLISPVVVGWDPHVQGNLVTSRLLPPLSTMHLNVRSAGDDADYAGLEGVFRSSSRDLLSGLPRPENEGEPVTHLALLGTDALGRDVFSRVVYGTRVSLAIGLAAALGSLLLGTCIGLASGLGSRRVDSILMRVTDMILSIPQLFLVLAVVATFGSSVAALVLALIVSGWMSIARVVRDESRRLTRAEFVLAARLLRVSTPGIIRKHLLPNMKGVLVAGGVLQFANVVLAEAALGFLGLGVQPPTATWGNMMGEATTHLSTAWWPALFPGLVLSVLVIAIHSVADRYVESGTTDLLTHDQR
jgi:peptide/nickel transport system permease protein